ncbi:hypothetical protein Csa_008439 [Cucumis sativus]|uniref:Uncharacterized protein n=1 Tax=Cucumis sativus TaxID=3659 RepID=A0A0A0KTQ2_CUCSA|nr:hypothetical protein Csa_008439 [Cucumis sativus]
MERQSIKDSKYPEERKGKFFSFSNFFVFKRRLEREREGGSVCICKNHCAYEIYESLEWLTPKQPPPLALALALARSPFLRLTLFSS